MKSNLKVPLVYVAGPYRAKTTYEIHCNIHDAREWGASLAELGVYPVIPHSNTAHFDGLADDEFWLAGTLCLLERCDAVLLMPRWADSKGATAEAEAARFLHKPIFDAAKEDGPLEPWIDSLRRT